MSDFKIVFIQGYTASHLADWYPNISKELDKLNIDYTIPDLPGGEHPHADEWLETLHKEISESNKPLVLVGHSLGTLTALLYLENYRPKVEKVFLIATFSNRVENAKRNNGEAYPDFFTHKIDLEKIKPRVGKFIVIHSKDDPSIPYKQAVEIVKDLDAKLVTYYSRGHFDLPDNAPIILKELKNELGF